MWVVVRPLPWECVVAEVPDVGRDRARARSGRAGRAVEDHRPFRRGRGRRNRELRGRRSGRRQDHARRHEADVHGLRLGGLEVRAGRNGHDGDHAARSAEAGVRERRGRVQEDARPSVPVTIDRADSFPKSSIEPPTIMSSRRGSAEIGLAFASLATTWIDDCEAPSWLMLSGVAVMLSDSANSDGPLQAAAWCCGHAQSFRTRSEAVPSRSPRCRRDPRRRTSPSQSTR